MSREILNMQWKPRARRESNIYRVGFPLDKMYSGQLHCRRHRGYTVCEGEECPICPDEPIRRFGTAIYVYEGGAGPPQAGLVGVWAEAVREADEGGREVFTDQPRRHD